MSFLYLPDEIIILIIEYFHHHNEILNYMLIHPDIQYLVENKKYNCYINYYMTFDLDNPKYNMSYYDNFNPKDDIKNIPFKYYELSKCSHNVSFNNYIQNIHIYAENHYDFQYNDEYIHKLFISHLSKINWINVKKLNIISYRIGEDEYKNKLFEELSIIGTLRNTIINLYVPNNDGLIYNDTYRYGLSNINKINDSITELYNGKNIIKFNTKSITEMISDNIQYSLFYKTKYYINDQVYELLLKSIKYNTIISLNPIYIYYSIRDSVRMRDIQSRMLIVESTICNNIDKIINNYYTQEYNNDVYTITKYTCDMLSIGTFYTRYVFKSIIDEFKLNVKTKYNDYIIVKPKNEKYKSIFLEYNFSAEHGKSYIIKTQIYKNLSILTGNILKFKYISENMSSLSGHVLLHNDNHNDCYKNKFSPRIYIYLTGSTLFKAMSSTPERYKITDIDIPIYIPNDNGFIFGMSDIAYTFIYKLVISSINESVYIIDFNIYKKYSKIFKRVRNYIESIDITENIFIFTDLVNLHHSVKKINNIINVNIQIKYRSRTKFIFDYNGIEFEVYRIFSPINQIVKHHPQPQQRCFYDFNSIYFTISCLETYITTIIPIDYIRPNITMSKKKNKKTWFKSSHEMGFSYAFRDQRDIQSCFN